jgi:Bacterial type II/III secretion system short domain
MFTTKMKPVTATVILLLFIFTPFAFAQQPTKPAAEDSFVTERGYKTKVLELKYRRPSSLYPLLSTLGSGFKGSTIYADDNFQLITVRDFPESIAVVEEAVRRLDTPQPPQPDFEFQTYILLGSSTDTSNQYPAELNNVLKQIPAGLNFKGFTLIVSQIQRVAAGPVGFTNAGAIEGQLFNKQITSGIPALYNYTVQPIIYNAATSSLQVGSFAFNLRFPLMIGNSPQYETVSFKTSARVADNEKVIIGTTMMGDKGLIVVLSARATK